MRDSNVEKMKKRHLSEKKKKRRYERCYEENI